MDVVDDLTKDGLGRPVESVRRALAVLEALNRHRIASVAVVHAETGLPKATIVRLLQTFCTLGYVRNDRRHGGYALASRVTSLACGFDGDPMVVEAARAWAIAFTRQHQWPLAIAVLDGDAVVVRFSTIPDSPVSPFHGTIGMRLGLLSRALGRAYLAFCPTRERDDLLRRLARSTDPEDGLAHDGVHAQRLLAAIRRSGYAARDPLVEPRNSDTAAVPIRNGRKVLATLGMTYFNSAVSREAINERYVPLLHDLAERIATNVTSFRSLSVAHRG
jgi:IclR family transcriptional regulator, mhp operon transcriptional activator